MGKNKMIKRALTIGGSDSGGGAGIQADIKTFSAFGVYGMSVLTAVTAQNSLNVNGITGIPPQFVSLQFESVMTDIGIDGVKTGMLFNAEIVQTITQKFSENPIPFIVIDPVIRSKSGDILLERKGIDLLKEKLIPLATLITFECRNRATFTADGEHTGHAQYDQNHFTVFSRGHPFFWDTGYEGWPPEIGTHNTHMIRLDDGSWTGYRHVASRLGTLLRWHFGLGNAPSMVAGDNTVAWNSPGRPELVDRSRRHLFVIPRGEGEAPYLLFHDDLGHIFTEQEVIEKGGVIEDLGN